MINTLQDNVYFKIKAYKREKNIAITAKTTEFRDYPVALCLRVHTTIARLRVFLWEIDVAKSSVSQKPSKHKFWNFGII